MDWETGMEEKGRCSPSEPKWHANGLPPLEELFFRMMEYVSFLTFHSEGLLCVSLDPKWRLFW